MFQANGIQPAPRPLQSRSRGPAQLVLAWIKANVLWVYFVLAYALTWGGSAVHLALSRGGDAAGLATPAQLPASLLVLLGPALAALAAARLENGRRGPGRLLRPLLAWKIGWRWWAFILVYPILHRLAVAGIRWATGGPPPRFFENSALPQGSILLALAVAVAANLVRGLGEEIGWRGYALPRLQRRWGPLVATLVLGVLWGLWHWHPANQALLGRSLVWHFLTVLPVTALYTWLYNRTGGSLLAAVILHMWQDVSEYIVPTGVYEQGAEGLMISAAINWAVALLLLSQLGGKPDEPSDRYR
jgi:membrane protease YdiL (CAAX protease family)